MTQLIRGLYNIAPQHKGGVVTIGNFDGVHRGHQALIEKVKERARALHVPSIVMTFEPLPLEFFAGALEKGAAITGSDPSKSGSDPIIADPVIAAPFSPARLTRWREKYLALAKTGIDYVFVLRFNAQLAAWRAEEFIQRVLVNGLAVEHVMVGDDFRFGYKREGDFTYLKTAGERYGFTVEDMPSIMQGHERVSSTLIRQALIKEDHELAERLLGRPYTMMGRVVHGDKLGRELGFPTANIYLHRAVTPVQGIYVVRMQGIEKQALPGVANVGIRPTVGGTRSLLEVYLFNFDSDIYGKHVTVEFCKKLRNEERYDNLELLKVAISKDALQAQNYFKQRGEL